MVEKRALLIGINYHSSETVSPLRGCINDVKLAKEVLTSKYDFPINNIVEMTDVSSNPNLVPIKVNILRELNKLVESSKPGSVIYVHFSCHGARQPRNDGDCTTPECLQEVLVPLDMEIRGGKFIGPILDEELHVVFQKLHDNVNFTVVFDCCHSGVSGHEHVEKTLDLEENHMGSVPRMIQHPRLKNKEKQVRKTSHIIEASSPTTEQRTVISPPSNFPAFYAACAVNQTAADVPFGSKHYGAFSFCFYNILKNQDNPPTLGYLWKNTNNLLLDFGMNQAPQLYTYGRERTNFGMPLNHPDFSKSFKFIEIPAKKIKEESRLLGASPLQPILDFMRSLIPDMDNYDLLTRSVSSIHKANLRSIAEMSMDELRSAFPCRSDSELESMGKAAHESIYATIAAPSRSVVQTEDITDSHIRELLGDIVSLGGTAALDIIETFMSHSRQIDAKELTRGFLTGLIKVSGPLVGQLASGVINVLHNKRELDPSHRQLIEEEFKQDLLQRGPAAYYTGMKLLDNNQPKEQREAAYISLADIIATCDLVCLEKATRVIGERGFWKEFTTGLLGSVIPGVHDMISGFSNRYVGEGCPQLTRTQQGIIGELFVAGGLRAAQLGVELLQTDDLNEQVRIVGEVLDVSDVEVAPLLNHLILHSNESKSNGYAPNREAAILDEYAAYPERITQIELSIEDKLHIRDLILIGGDSDGATAAGIGVRLILNRDSSDPCKRNILGNLVKIAGPVALNIGKQLLAGGTQNRSLLCGLPSFSQIIQVAKNHAPRILVFVGDLVKAKDTDEKKKILHEIFQIAGPVALDLTSKIIDKGEIIIGDILFGKLSRDIESIVDRLSDPTEKTYYIYALVRVDLKKGNQHVFQVGSTTHPTARLSKLKSIIGGTPFLMKILCSIETTRWGAYSTATYFHFRYNRCNSDIPLSEDNFDRFFSKRNHLPHSKKQVYKWTYNSNEYTPLQKDLQISTYLSTIGWKEHVKATRNARSLTWEAFCRWCSGSGEHIYHPENQKQHIHGDW